MAAAGAPVQLKFDFKAGNFDRFFDRVFTKVERQQIRNLERLASWIRLTAQRSIRDAPKKAATIKKKGLLKYGGEVYARPGQPPLNKVGYLKLFIYYGYDQTTKSVVIGPAKLNRPSGAPRALEHGGATMVSVGGKKNRHWEKRSIQARPFMQPALDKSKQQKKFEEIWRDSVK